MEKITIIRSKDRFHWSDLSKLWEYHELLYYLTWRDLKVRYKQTIVGVAWVVFQPFVSMVVFSVIFGQLAGIPSDGVPYPIFVFVGLLFWQFFASALSDVSNCLVTNQHIISKVYFPRILLPLSLILTRLVDFAVASGILVGLMIYYRFMPNIWVGLAIFPLLLAMTFAACLGFGLFLAALNVKYRDVRFILPFFIQIMMYLTPVVYSTTIVGHQHAWVFAFNPISSVIKNARSAFLGVWQVNWLELGLSMAVCLVALAIGWAYFRKVEKDSVDLM